jgi:thiamine pyrophosphokinase
MSGKVALVVANGTLLSAELLATLLTACPYILAADGGANRLFDRGIVPDAVIGDFDSISVDLPSFVERIPAPDQNFTDLDKAVAYLVKRGFETIWLIGATGDRLDHTFGALSVLAKYAQKADIALIDDVGTARAVTEPVTLETEVGHTISLIALGEVPSVKTTGLRWNLDGELLAPGVRDGISNKADAEQVTIATAVGVLIVYLHHT